jgi:hypothetical protein
MKALSFSSVGSVTALESAFRFVGISNLML